jgi:hypothetical protein
MKFDFLGPEIRVSDGQPLNTLYPIFFNVFGKYDGYKIIVYAPTHYHRTFTTPSGNDKNLQPAVVKTFCWNAVDIL